MSTELTIKKGRGVPRDADLAEAELAVDLDSGTLYSKLGDGLVHPLNESPDSDNYGHWKLQVDYGTPYQVVSGATANFEGTNGIKVTRTGDTITIDGSELDLDEEADNYQYWQYKIDGFSTTNVMSTQVLDFQSGDGINITKEGFGIKISATGTGGGGSSLWEQNGNDIYYSNGNVGIGIASPQNTLHLKSAIQIESPAGNHAWIDKQDAALIVHAGNGSELDLKGDTFKLETPNGDSRLAIDATGNTSFNGNVGIGMAPLRSTAKEQLEAWKSQLDARLKDDPKADKKAVTLEITDDAFAVLPSEDKLAKWMETRAAGDRLQVDGNISATGTVNAGFLSASAVRAVSWNNPGENIGLGLAGNELYPVNGDNTATTDGVIDLGKSIRRFKDAYFSGKVNADTASIGSYEFSAQDQWTRGGSGLRLGATNIYPLDGSGNLTSSQVDFGSLARQFKDAYFSGTVTANAFVGDGSGLTGISGGSGGLPDGGYTYGWSITATDFIATSDERLKDNITTAPVGLIDSLKGREWEWAESGEKGSGVVAQELEQVLPHLVHEDEEGMKSVAYNGLIAYLIEEIKDLKAQVEALK